MDYYYYYFLAERREAAFFLNEGREVVGCCLDKK